MTTRTFMRLNIVVFIVSTHVVATLARLLSLTPVYSQDTYQNFYSPNTVPEELYFQQNSSSAPPAIVVQREKIEQEAQRVQQLLSETRNPYLKRQDVVSVRCPSGWTAVGPFCTTLSLAQPFTECPLTRRRYFVNGLDPILPVSNLPGLCERQDITGAQLDCPEGFTLVSEPLENRTASGISGIGSNKLTTIVECRASAILPYHLITESLPNPQSSFPHLPVCPAGMVAQREGCSAFLQRLSPTVTCPEGYAMEPDEINEFALYGKQRLRCKRRIGVKGRLWCPNGYHLSGEIFPNKPFGTVIPGRMMTANLEQSYVATREATSLRDYGWTQYARFKQLDAVVCFQVLATLWTNCNHVQCQSPHLKELKRTLVNWAFRRLQTDANYVLYWGLPSGRDANACVVALVVGAIFAFSNRLICAVCRSQTALTYFFTR